LDVKKENAKKPVIKLSDRVKPIYRVINGKVVKVYPEDLYASIRHPYEQNDYKPEKKNVQFKEKESNKAPEFKSFVFKSPSEKSKNSHTKRELTQEFVNSLNSPR